MNCVPIVLPAFRAEGHVVPLLKVVIERWARTHPCRQVRLMLEACQFGGKGEVVALYLEDVFLQIEDELYKLAVGGVFDYSPDLFECAERFHLRALDTSTFAALMKQ